MQIHGENAIYRGGLQQVCHKLRGDWFSGTTLLVLPRVPEPRDDSGHPPCRCQPCRLNHYEEFHQVLIHWTTGGLYYEDVRTPDALFVLDVDLAIGKSLYQHPAFLSLIHISEPTRRTPIS